MSKPSETRACHARNGQMPAAEEERHDDGGAGDHGRVFAEEEERELHRAVFGVIAADQLGLGLGQIERQAIRFRENRDREDDKRNEHRDREEPFPADSSNRR